MTTTRPRRRSRLIALLTLPLLLLLAGCFRMDLAVTINSDDTAEVSMEVQDQSGFASREDIDCSDMETEIAGDSAATTVEEIGEEGSYGCRVTGSGEISEMTGEGVTIAKDGDNYVFTFEGDDSADLGDFEDLSGDMEPEISISVTFPGKVLSADDGAEIDGNTARWSGVQAFAAGGTATGEGSEGVLGGGTGTIVWIVLGVVVVLAVIALVVLLVLRKKGSTPPATGNGDPGSYSGPGAPSAGGPDGPAPYGQDAPPVPPAPGSGTPPPAPAPGSTPPPPGSAG